MSADFRARLDRAKEAVRIADAWKLLGLPHPPRPGIVWCVHLFGRIDTHRSPFSPADAGLRIRPIPSIAAMCWISSSSP